jgi:protein-S-isoprenylcysteine O-methyltransferase Ste14
MADRKRMQMLRWAAFFLMFAYGMFVSARAAWWPGLLFLVVFLLQVAGGAIYLWRKNPDVIVARSQAHKGTKGWDRILTSFLRVLLITAFVVAWLDNQGHWSRAPWWVIVLGYVLLTGGMVGSFKVLSVNKFAERTVRIQRDRGQRVIDIGPYAVVRHPMYAAAFLILLGLALALGSFWAVIPTVLASLLLVVRTVLEDRTLQNELGGYKEYAARIRYRLVPGVW